MKIICSLYLFGFSTEEKKKRKHDYKRLLCGGVKGGITVLASHPAVVSVVSQPARVHVHAAREGRPTGPAHRRVCAASRASACVTRVQYAILSRASGDETKRTRMSFAGILQSFSPRVAHDAPSPNNQKTE